jgi:AraC-like DNA-binding protein
MRPMSEFPADATTLVRRPVAAALRPFVSAIVGYAEHAQPPELIEPASLDVPVVLSFAGGFRIALDRPAGPGDAVASFVSGLHPGFVSIASDGAAACVQITFTPPGARLALGLPMDALAGRMVPLADLPGLGLAPLGDRLAGLGWAERLAAAEAWAAARVRAGLAAQRSDARATRHAYLLLARSAGAPRIGALADRLGWSRKRLVARFREEIGLAPKPVARILRFRKATRLAAAGAPDWSDIAAACGYADQAHLAREFRRLAGASPGGWARR